MSIEVRFTIKGQKNESPFTIVEEVNDSLCLYSETENGGLKIQLKNDNGLLSLEEPSPFEEDLEIVADRLSGLSADWIELKSQGFENTTDFNVSKNKPGYGPDDIFVENKPFSLKQIVELVRDGDIELSPNFQRNFIWDKTRQSKLIESILLGLPLPSIYLSQYKDGRLTVVDGLQRITTIKKFLENDLVLSNLEYLKECNGYRYKDLEGILSNLRLRRFGQTQIMCFVIDYRSPSQLKFDLFRRLNTGGKPLNNQEIRNCLSRPEVQHILKSMVDLDSFKDATDSSVKDTRMEAREAVLRFIYFYEQYTPQNPLGKYNGDMETTLDNFIDELNYRDLSKIKGYIDKYDNALRIAHYLFGAFCFRKILPSTLGMRRAQINKLIMLTFSVLLVDYNFEDVIKSNRESSLVESLADFIHTEDRLFDAITWSTNSKWNIETGFKSFKKFLEQNIKTNHGK